MALRITAICSKEPFTIYGLGHGLAPIRILHTTLLPLNLWRLTELAAYDHQVASVEARIVEAAPVAASVRPISRMPRLKVETDEFAIIVLFCGVGLLASLLFMSHGIDPSPDFF